MAYTMFGADTKTAAPARRGVLTRLARKPTAQRVVCHRCRLDRGSLAVESDESDGSPFDPAHFTLTLKEAEATVAIFENAQRHDTGIESSSMRARSRPALAGSPNAGGVGSVVVRTYLTMH